MQILENYSLQALNTFGLDSKARYFARIEDTNSLIQLLSDPKWKTVPKFILGGGSNVLLTQNLDGLVLLNELKGIEILKESDSEVWIRAMGGENWHEFVLHTIQKDYWGIENLSLIPGSVGASPIQNIGAYGAEVKDVIEEVSVLDLQTQDVKTFSNEDCQFGYRDSIFKRELKGKVFVLSVTFKLSKSPKPNISYAALRQELEASGAKDLNPKIISDAVIKIRKSKLPDPAEIGNSGSFFKNPEIDKDTFLTLQRDYPDISYFPMPNGKVKLAAAWLIDKLGWKGYRQGDAGVHSRQALVLVNYGKAEGKVIYRLSEEILQSVQRKFGIELEREVNVW